MKFVLIFMALAVVSLIGVAVYAILSATTTAAIVLWAILLVANLINAWGIGRLLAYEF